MGLSKFVFLRLFRVSTNNNTTEHITLAMSPVNDTKERLPKMTELMQIKSDIASTKAELATVKSKLADAEKAKNEASIAKYEADVIRKENLLTQQQKKENLLLKAGSGNIIIA